MLRYYKKIENDYICCIGTGPGGEEITKEEYDEILGVIRSRPVAEAGYVYRLKTNLAWELTEAPEEETDTEISDEEALDIILGGECS